MSDTEMIYVIATKVMGWQKEPVEIPELRSWQLNGEWVAELDWNPLTNDADNAMVRTHFAQPNRRVELSWDEGKWTCSLQTGGTDEYPVWAEAWDENFNRALCIGALRAVGVEVE